MSTRDERNNALEARTRRFAVEVVKVCRGLSDAHVCGDMARQLAKAATSVAVNHRAVRRARSLKEFSAKLQIVNEEVDEAVHWLEVITESGSNGSMDLKGLIREAIELRSIFAAARRTTRKRLTSDQNP